MLEQISGNAARFMIYALVILSILLIFLAIYYLINIGNRYIEGKKRINIDLSLITKIFLGILIFYLINILFNKFPILGYTLSSVIIAIIFAYIINPIVNYLERKGVKRQFGVIIVYISAILIFGILIVSVIPKTINEVSNLLTSLPGMVDTLIREFNNFLSNVFAKFNIELPKNFINIYKETNPKVNGNVETPQIVSNILDSIKGTINDLIVKVQGSLMGSLSNVISKPTSEFTPIYIAGEGQNLDTGAQVVHAAPHTTSTVNTKSISKSGGIAIYRGLVEIKENAVGAKNATSCESLMLDNKSRSDTIPTIKIENNNIDIGHEAKIGRISDSVIFYLMSRGISEQEAKEMVVRGFAEPIAKELPMEYAVEMNNLINLELVGAIG
ncbi:AI-2E family transporter [Peptoniphilus genitalis]